MKARTGTLTSTNAELEAQRANTPPGMAHWAGTGPRGRKCFECKSFGYYYDRPSDGKRTRRTESCEVYYKRVGVHGDKFSPVTLACKYFQSKT